jgi:hypothetical protein
MQGLGYLKDNETGEKILCLVRQGSYGRYLKRRKSGKEGFHLTDEEIFLNEERERMDRLKSGENIFC